MIPRPGWQHREHGTPAAARRHRRYRQDLCPACRQAEALASARYRALYPARQAARQEAAAERYRTARAAGCGAREAKLAMRSPARLAQVLAGAA